MPYKRRITTRNQIRNQSHLLPFLTPARTELRSLTDSTQGREAALLIFKVPSFINCLINSSLLNSITTMSPPIIDDNLMEVTSVTHLLPHILLVVSLLSKLRDHLGVECAAPVCEAEPERLWESVLELS